MTYAEELYADIRLLLSSEAAMSERYHLLGRLLDRMLKERTQADQVEYAGLLPRIYALSQRHGLSQQPLCVLHTNVVRTGRGEFSPEETDLLYDAKALCQAVAAFYAAPVPTDIARLLPEQWRAWTSATAYSDQRIRLVVQDWDDHHLYGYDASDTTQTLLRVAHGEEWQLSRQLYPHATLNLLDITTDTDGVLHPRLLVLEPDYLVDITAICQCLKESGPSPYYYLMDKFLPREDTLAIQLGNVANQFLDDAVNGHEPFLASMQKSFRDYPLKYCTLDGVDEDFFRQCRQHHQNIRTAVGQYFREAGIDVERGGIQLEPSFICEALGLQGRMDLLTEDLGNIVELKSGRQDDYHGTFRLDHALQMALYKEVLHYSLGRSRREVKTLLLYSRYPHLHDIRLGQSHIVQAMVLRNGIVHIDRLLRTDSHRFLRSLGEADFNPLSSQGKLYVQYIRPRVLEFLHTIQAASPLAYDYFCTMVSFVGREQFLAKMGDDRPDSDRGFAQAWLCDTETKRLHGNILTNLRLHPIVNEEGLMTHLECYLQADLTTPNFREGDSVVLYERNGEGDLLTNHQSLRCYVEVLQPDCLVLRLGYPQRPNGFLHPDSRYAIEPSHSDSLFAAQYRGLYALLRCPAERRDLLLGQRPPTVLSPQPLRLPIANAEVRDIVSAALRARDYYLLVGPPGSGKTSVALRSMVMELMADPSGGDLLLMAYTNRAVDEICQMLESIDPAPAYLRLGQELSCAPAFRPRLLRNAIAHCHNRGEILRSVSPVRIFCGTVASLGGSSELFRLKTFRTAILDEASQVLEPQLLPLLTQPEAIGRLIMIGDHKQLPAVVVQHSEQSRVGSEALRRIGLTDCRNSLFERIHLLVLQQGNTQFCNMLSHQGRMHADISRFVSHSYYGDQLGIVPLPHQQAPLPWRLFDSDDAVQRLVAVRRMAAVNVVPDRRLPNNKVNAAEASQVAQLVVALCRLHELNHLPWQPRTGIGIIVPFRGQIAVVRQALEAARVPDWQQIAVDTVERYQGSQREVIIFSTVVSQPYQMQILSIPVEADGQPIDRKLNVAVTRARQQFFLVGNLRLLQQADDYRRMIQYMTGSLGSASE